MVLIRYERERRSFNGIYCNAGGIIASNPISSASLSTVEIPEVIGQILVGIIAGPALLNWVHLNSMMNEFQEIGVIILMFIAGLESDLSLLKKYLKPAVVVANCRRCGSDCNYGARKLLFRLHNP